ncbi:MAG: ThuA domain-containing protein [Opitutaceae bacterium]
MGSLPASAQVPSPWTSQDVGGPALAGSASESAGTFTIDGAGSDIWGNSDEFHFVWQAVTGDISVIAQVTSQTDTNDWAKAGVMIRESVNADSAHAMTVLTPGNGVQFQRRTSTGSNTNNNGTSSSAPVWVRMDRIGNNFTGYHSTDGNSWNPLGSVTISMSNSVVVGLAVTSHSGNNLSTAIFTDVSVSIPVPPPEPEYSTDGYFPIFNGVNFDHWYSYLNGLGVNNDPNNILKVNGGLIHILDLDENGSNQPFGYFSTNENYRNYRLRFEYKWGTKKYAPRATALRDSGLLYHFVGNDVVWPTSVESQVQENDTGDFYFLGSSIGDSTVASGTNMYQEGGVPVIGTGGSVLHSAAYDSLTEWNVAEVIVTEDEGIHLVNSKVNNRGTNFKYDGTIVQDEGRIAFQVEGAEIFYRNIEVKPLFTTGGGPEYKVLVFSKTAGFRHGSISDGIIAIQEIAASNGFTVDTTEDATLFTDENLEQYACVIWLNTTGIVLNTDQKAAFERYIQSGGGYVGVHSATDTHRTGDWSWYGNLVGAFFANHPSIQEAELCVCDLNHPSTGFLGTTWIRTDEWYNFDRDPAENTNISVLVTIDETTYSPGSGAMGSSHPITWYQEYDGGRSWYTAMGHGSDTFDEPQYRMHLLGGIEWAAGKSSKATSDKTILFDGSDTSQWEKRSDGSAVSWPIVDDGSLEVDVGSGDIVTTGSYNDFRLHLEFRPNSTNATGEQDRGNSGVFLQGRYEIQILDTFDRTLDGENDCGAIYSVRNADSNEAWPADAWQTYDIWFRAPRWDGASKTENAYVTVFWNGTRIHDSVEIPNFTATGFTEGPTDGPIMLQDHDNAVRFRNVWIEPGVSLPPPLNPEMAVSSIDYDLNSDAVTLEWNANFPGPFNVVAGDDDDLKNGVLPVPAATDVTSPATFDVPASLSGEPAVFFQVTD